MKSLVLTVTLLNMMSMLHSQSITFTNELIYEDYPSIKNPTENFFETDPIYAIATLKDAIINTPIIDNPGAVVTMGLFVKIDGKAVVSDEKATFSEIVPGALFSWMITDVYSNNLIPLCLSPSEDDRFKSAQNKQGPYRAFMGGLAEAGVGEHKIEVELKFMDGGVISEAVASGAFAMNVRNVIASKTTSRFPAAKMVDPQLSAAMEKALKESGWTYTVKKIHIVESEWEIHRDAWGHITHRSIDTYVGFTMQDGSCKVFNISFKQNYEGEHYGKTQVNATGNSFVVNCDEIN